MFVVGDEHGSLFRSEGPVGRGECFEEADAGHLSIVRWLGGGRRPGSGLVQCVDSRSDIRGVRNVQVLLGGDRVSHQSLNRRLFE